MTRTARLRQALSMVEVAVAITVLSAAGLAMSAFSSSNTMVLMANDSSWAVRIGTAQADCVRRRLTSNAPDAAMLSAPQLTFSEAPIGGVPTLNVGSPITLANRGVPAVSASSVFYYLNPGVNISAGLYNVAVNAQLMRVVMYMTQAGVNTIAKRPPGNRRVMACQIEVYKGDPTTTTPNNATGGTLLYSTSFMATRYDADGPALAPNRYSAGFYRQ